VVVVLVALALAFDFMNGFHDAANSIATVVSTGVLKPGQAGVFSAAVADYRPSQVVAGKICSGSQGLQLSLEPTEKVIDLVRLADPDLHMVTFKYLEGVSEAELLAVARQRLQRFEVVVANRGEEVQGLEQSAWIVTRQGETKLRGKPAIAAALADHLERALAVGP
jgi:phosphopantothenoylcysteine decarboxylase/phosphopantothenate--cysteine ligase